MRAVADGRLSVDSAQFGEEMFFCVGCLACETVCPAGVNYAKMLEHARAEVRLRGRRLMRWLFAKPARLRAAAKVLRAISLPPAILPGRLRQLYELRPRIEKKFSFDLIREIESPIANHRPRRFRVGLLTGCVQDVAYANVNRDTVDVLLANGCEVVTPRMQVCCGALLAHNGELDLAGRLVRQNADAFKDVDLIVVNSAGCGSFMRKRCEKVRDVNEFLVDIGITPPGHLNACVTYHEPCHLVHGQKISRQPRELLRSIPGVKLIELPEATWCCGSAGIYNITQPVMSMTMLERKMKKIAATGAQIVATGNPGCIGQLRYGAKRFGVKVEVVHPVTLLARAYRGSTEWIGSHP
jgi:glycolate oxidase iron-sulfur subunit